MVFTAFRGVVRRISLISVAALNLSACALTPWDDDGAVRTIGSKVGLLGQVREPAPFVKESRPEGELEYKAVGVTPTREVNARDAGSVRQMEAELNARREANERVAAQPRPASIYDGKVEPGFRPPPPPPVPVYTGHDPEKLRGVNATETAKPETDQKAAKSVTKNKAAKKKADTGKPST